MDHHHPPPWPRGTQQKAPFQAFRRPALQIPSCPPTPGFRGRWLPPHPNPARLGLAPLPLQWAERVSKIRLRAARGGGGGTAGSGRRAARPRRQPANLSPAPSPRPRRRPSTCARTRVARPADVRAGVGRGAVSPGCRPCAGAGARAGRGAAGWRGWGQGPGPRPRGRPLGCPFPRPLSRTPAASLGALARLPAGRPPSPRARPPPCPGSLGPERARGLRVLGASLAGRPRGPRAGIWAPCGAQPWARAHHSGACSPPDTAPFLPGAGAGAPAPGAPHPGPAGPPGSARPAGRARGTASASPRPAPAKPRCLYFMHFLFLAAAGARSDSLCSTDLQVCVCVLSEPRGWGGGAGGRVGVRGEGIWCVGGRPLRRVPAAARARRRGRAERRNPSAPASVGRVGTADPNLAFGPT